MSVTQRVAVAAKERIAREEAIARGGRTEVLEGDWQPKRIVVLEFESLARAHQWWDSPEYRDGKARAAAQALRIGSEPPQLAADLEAAAKEAGIQIPETADRPDAAAGKRYIEHSLDVKLRKVDLKSLANFLSKVETGRALVLITRLQIRRSFGGDGTSVDVDLTATTYERIKDGSKKPPLKGAAAGKGKG